jgi:hypothetical protein
LTTWLCPPTRKRKKNTKQQQQQQQQQQQLDTTITNGADTDTVCTTSAYQSDVAVVPSVVIHQGGAVGHACDLVTIVPPAHHTSLAVRVLGQPVVSFSEIVKDLS